MAIIIKFMAQYVLSSSTAKCVNMWWSSEWAITVSRQEIGWESKLRINCSRKIFHLSVHAVISSVVWDFRSKSQVQSNTVITITVATIPGFNDGFIVPFGIVSLCHNTAITNNGYNDQILFPPEDRYRLVTGIWASAAARFLAYTPEFPSFFLKYIGPFDFSPL